MSNNIDNNDWISAVKQKADQATREVPQGAWDAIAKSLPQQDVTPAKKGMVAPRLWKSIAAAAAVAIAVTSAFFLINDKDPGQAQSEPIAKVDKSSAQSPEQQVPETEQAAQSNESLLAQNTPAPSWSGAGQTVPVAPRINKRNSQAQIPQEEDYYADYDEDIQRYPDEAYADTVFNYEDYFYDIETMQALEELYAEYDNAMNKEAMEPWRAYSDSTYQQYLVYDANARRAAREKMALPKDKEKPSLLMAAYGSGLISGDNKTVESGSSAMMAAPAIRLMADKQVAPPVNYSYHHNMPLTFGLTFTKRIVGNLYGNLGLNFTSMSSDVTPDNGSDQFKQNVKLIGVPFGVRWNFWRYRGLTTFVGGEGLVERVVSAKFNNDNLTIKRLQWSVHATAGIQYNFNKHVGIYVEPKLSHYITTLPLNTLRNEHPFNFNLQMGISLDF